MRADLVGRLSGELATTLLQGSVILHGSRADRETCGELLEGLENGNRLYPTPPG